MTDMVIRKSVTTCCRSDWKFKENTSYPICNKCGCHSAISDLNDLIARDNENKKFTKCNTKS